MDWENASFNLAFRFDYVDWNLDLFKGTETTIGDDLIAFNPGISLRPSQQTVFRFNYRYILQSDVLNNPAALTNVWLFGFSTYF